MSDSWEYIMYTHKDAEIDLLSDFVSKSSNPTGIISGVDAARVARYEDDRGTLNIERMWANFAPKTKEAKQKYESDLEFLQSQDLDSESLNSYSLKFEELVFGTQLALPVDHLVTDVLAFEAENQIADHTQFTSFLADKLEELYGDEGFREVSKFRDFDFSVTQEMPQVTVLVWCRALSDPQDQNLQGSLINISKFVRSLTTSVNANGGNFSFELATIRGEYDSQEGWKLHSDFEDRDFFYEQESIATPLRKGAQNSRFFFESIFNKNDVVFVAFEPLEIDEDMRRRIRKKLSVPRQSLPKGVFDMIGLVDNTQKSRDPQTSSDRITVQGRDLMKLLIDDGLWFFPYEFVPEGMVANSTDERWMKRHEGRLIGLQQSALKSIQDAVQFVFNALANVSVVPDELFSAYGEERTLVYSEQGGNEARGIWQIIKLVIDDAVTERRIADTSIGNELGSMMNFIRKICQSPWVEFFADTYGSQFFFVVRQPPFSENLYKDLATRENIITVREQNVVSEDLSMNQEDIYSWYRLQPQPLIGGTANIMGAAYLKAVHFPEYMEIWGDNALDVVSNYIPYWPVSGQNQQNSISDIVEQGIRDLQYLVQSNAYNPFVRTGQVVINGDRRVKYGTIIFYEKTGEYFYVDNVTHGYKVEGENIDRATTLQLSRGMVADHLDRYFNIIDTSIDEDEFRNAENSVDWSLKVQQNWKVNREVFNFFLRREQFS